MKWNDKDRTLTINDRQGNYKGMLKNRKFNIIIVEPGKGCGDGDATTFDQAVPPSHTGEINSNQSVNFPLTPVFQFYKYSLHPSQCPIHRH